MISVQEMIAENEEMDDDTNEDENVNTEPAPTFADALKGFETMRNFLYSHELSVREQKDVTNVENLLFGLRRKHCVQAKFPQYFK